MIVLINCYYKRLIVYKHILQTTKKHKKDNKEIVHLFSVQLKNGRIVVEANGRKKKGKAISENAGYNTGQWRRVFL